MAFCNQHGIAHSAFLDWDYLDRVKAIAYEAEKAERCQMCGSAPWEWEADRYAYEAVAMYCPGCYLTDLAAKDEETRPGVTYRLAATSGEQAEKRRRVAEAFAERGTQ
jgi:hypothetical protein